MPAPSTAPSITGSTLDHYLQDVRSLVIEELQSQLPPDGPWTGRLYERMLDYPLRAAKALRPALCIATCRALGGALGSVLPTATSLELFHNAFLVHDDVEDGSELRRGGPTLCREVGVPVAVNVGDGMLAMALRPLLRNSRLLGVQQGLAVMERVVEMAQRSAEGQALELEWIRTGTWALPSRVKLLPRTSTPQSSRLWSTTAPLRTRRTRRMR